MSDFKPGDHVEVMNPGPTGAAGVVLEPADYRGFIKVRWTEHGWGMVGKVGYPQARLLRHQNANR